VAEPIYEQITSWMFTALDGKQDADTSLTIAAKRPKDNDWSLAALSHGDAIIEERGVEHMTTNGANRVERGTWMVYGVLRDPSITTYTGTLAVRMAETIRSLLHAGNANGKACGGIATKINCPTVEYGDAQGCNVVAILVNVEYATDYKSTYA